MSPRLSGVYVALLTPMHSDGRVNYEELERQVLRMEECGVDAVFVLGTNGEFYALRSDEKIEVMRVARRAAPAGLRVCAGVGSVTTAEGVMLAREAESAGVDSIAVITPYFADLSQDQLLRHFRAVAESVSLPTILYNIPARTGNTVDPSTLAALQSVPNIAGIKDSSGSAESLNGLLGALRPDRSLFVGSDGIILDGLQRGAAGCVSGMANIVPRLVVRLYQSWKSGALDDARSAQDELQSVRRILSLGNSNSVVKCAAVLLGQPVGPCREPAQITDAVTVNRIRTILIECGVMTVSEQSPKRDQPRTRQ